MNMMKEVREVRYVGTKFESLATFKRWRADVERFLKGYGLENHLAVESGKNFEDYFIGWVYDQRLGATKSDMDMVDIVMAKLQDTKKSKKMGPPRKKFWGR